MSKTNFILDLGDLGEQEFSIEYRYHPGRPARIYGPPEKCSEAEPAELELLRAWFQGQELSGKLGDLVQEYLNESDAFYEHVAEIEQEQWA